MKTWEKFLPDYEIVNLNFKNLENYIPKEVLNKIIYKNCKEFQSFYVPFTQLTLILNILHNPGTLITRRN